MKRVLYISTARSAMSVAELEHLLRRARAANKAAQITGLLVVGGRRFLQVLEGPDQEVDATFERIAQDERHFALVKLHDKPIIERSFAAWAMGFEKGGATSMKAGASLVEQVEAIIAPIEDATLRAYFAGFAATMAPAF